MKSRGRKSTASMSVVHFSRPEIEPPPGLSSTESAIFRTIVSSKPPDYFGAEHVALMANLARAFDAADKLGAIINSTKVDELIEREGTLALARLIGMHDRTCRLALSIATKLRLTHQAKYRAEHAATIPVASPTLVKPWNFGKTSSQRRQENGDGK